ncbi:phosphate acyltransferase [candidate division WOR-1 bacterium DG_54_3]|uniref:Phosphate acyltransferase n=1 Tax=candidate division WOR-1 bacterium DG_54_3 TaxID=1703775 RepID=A0A0S7Y0P1_UNCSA|nr:MAG: phosphate acyltransferase [candidate division WOR-1 bacterium DG_54_3]
MRVAVDAMGGDFAPAEIVKGAVQASRELQIEIILVGDLEKLSRELKKYKERGELPVVAASEVIEMDESPAQAVKQKKDASINVAVSLVKDGKANAVISAGNTGALMASALFKLGRIPGVERPAIATEFPLPTGKVLLLDMGANVDCKPKHLVQFAEMGNLYARHVLHIDNPQVGLLNIGEEKEKGNELTRQAWPLLKQAPINFVGNVESKEILRGKADVVVCDGFVGNLILKFGESISLAVFQLLKNELSKGIMNKIGLAFLYPSLRRLRKTLTYDEYGAAPLLGISGIVFKAHGRAKANAIKNAVRETAEAVKEDMVSCISKLREKT